MKIRKKLAALLLSTLMVLTLLPAGISASAAVAGTITVKDANGTSVKSTSTYSAYEIVSFKATIDADSKSPTYNKTVYTDPTILGSYKTVIQSALTSAGITPGATDDAILKQMNSLNADQMATLAVALHGAATSGNINSQSGVISVPEYGYYLVIETANNANDGTILSAPILVGVPEAGASTINSSLAVKVKTSYAKVQKKIVIADPAVPTDHSKDTLVDSSTARVGDTVNYQSLSDIPFYSPQYTTPTYYLTDTFSAGLKFTGITDASIIDNSGTVLKSSLTKGNDYTLTSDDHSFTLTLSSDNIKAYGEKGGKLKVYYSAVVTDQAVKGSTGNPNSITLDYSDRPDSHTHRTPPDTVITYINLLTINKLNDKDSQVQGAGFTLYQQNKDGSWPTTGIETVVTDVYGHAPFTKLLPGYTYKIVETTVPVGLSKADDITFTLKATNTNAGGATYDIPNQNINVLVPPADLDDASANTDVANGFKAKWSSDNSTVVFDNSGTAGLDGTMSVKIIDNTGFVLPGTGGIGTTIFFVSGIAILLLGGCLAFVYTRKKRTGNHFQH